MRNGRKEKDVQEAMDKKMLECIDSELKRLEDASNIEAYKKQIHIRREGFKLIFSDFDFFIKIIRSHKEKINIRKNEIGYKEILDKILKDKITYKLEQIYKKAVIWGEGSEDLFNCKISQIIDRQIGIGEILDNYNECMDIIENYKKDIV